MLSVAFKIYARLLRQLHALIRGNNGDSYDADRLRDEMDGAWAAMDSDERALTRVLSSDLYDLDSNVAPEPVRTPEESKKLKTVADASQRGDFEFVLRNLREVQKFAAPHFFAYLRGRGWSTLGDNDTAVVFFERATELAPGNVNYKYLLLDTRAKSEEQHQFAEQQVNTILAHPNQQPAKLVAKAADLRFVATRNMQNDEANSVYEQLLNVYNQLNPRLRDGAEAEPSVLVQTLTMKGLCYEHLNDINDAFAAYTEALQIQPQNEAALTARGLLSYGENTQALADLRAACNLNTPIAWPFLFLAHHALATGQFKACIELAEAALQRHPTERAEADLLEWLAISYHSLGSPPEQVEALFERAVERAPQNGRIVGNFARFKESVAKISPNVAWTYEPGAAVREYGRMAFANEFQPMLAA